jgi:hypothetical protein
MLIYLQNFDQLNFTRLMLDIDGAVCLVKTYRTLSLPLALEWLIMKALQLSDFTDLPHVTLVIFLFYCL